MIENSRRHGPFDRRWRHRDAMSVPPGSRRVTAAGEEDGLDWRTFSTRLFPDRRRHDLEVLEAFMAFRNSPHGSLENTRQTFSHSQSLPAPAGSRSVRARPRPATNRRRSPVEEAERLERAKHLLVGAAAVEDWEAEGGAIQ